MISENAFDTLRATTLFAGFTDDQLQVVPKVALPHEFAAGDSIVSEGETPSRSLFLILEGEAEVVIGGEPHRVLGPGSHFGEMALLTGAPRAAAVVARTEVTALELSDRHLQGLIAANPQVAMGMLAELANRLRYATETLAAVIQSSEDAAAAAHDLGVRARGGDSGHLGAIEYPVELA